MKPENNEPLKSSTISYVEKKGCEPGLLFWNFDKSKSKANNILGSRQETLSLNTKSFSIVFRIFVTLSSLAAQD